jgi:hypothetical protein
MTMDSNTERLNEQLTAECAELRRLWIENEGDIIELKSMLTRFFRLKWYQRLFIKWEDTKDKH